MTYVKAITELQLRSIDALKVAQAAQLASLKATCEIAATLASPRSPMFSLPPIVRDMSDLTASFTFALLGQQAAYAKQVAVTLGPSPASDAAVAARLPLTSQAPTLALAPAPADAVLETTPVLETDALLAIAPADIAVPEEIAVHAEAATEDEIDATEAVIASTEPLIASTDAVATEPDTVPTEPDAPSLPSEPEMSMIAAEVYPSAEETAAEPVEQRAEVVANTVIDTPESSAETELEPSRTKFPKPVTSPTGANNSSRPKRRPGSK